MAEKFDFNKILEEQKERFEEAKKSIKKFKKSLDNIIYILYTNKCKKN